MMEAPSGFELLFSEKEGDEPRSREPGADAVDELPDELRRIVERVSSPERTDR